jgi:predicted TPR repeat methyltransferase
VNQSLPPDYFERMFASDPDPWRFETSPYERAKFDRSIAALDGRRHRRALEIGCANGVLTYSLAPHCDAIVSIDVSDTALASARARNTGFSHVQFANMTFPANAPDGRFDLIVMSEVAYYWSAADIAAAGVWIAAHVVSGGDLLLVHWIGDTDYPQTGDDAVRLLHEALPNVSVVHANRHKMYRLDLWRMA